MFRRKESITTPPEYLGVKKQAEAMVVEAAQVTGWQHIDNMGWKLRRAGALSDAQWKEWNAFIKKESFSHKKVTVGALLRAGVTILAVMVGSGAFDTGPTISTVGDTLNTAINTTDAFVSAAKDLRYADGQLGRFNAAAVEYPPNNQGWPCAAPVVVGKTETTTELVVSAVDASGNVLQENHIQVSPGFYTNALSMPMVVCAKDGQALFTIRAGGAAPDAGVGLRGVQQLAQNQARVK